MKQIIEFLRTHNNYLIIPHARPDGDTLGSSAALCEGLRMLGKETYVYRNEDVTERYKPFVSAYYPQSTFNPDNYIAVDSASVSRLPLCFQNTVIDLSIDHHASGKPFGKLNYIKGSTASCAELIYDLLSEMDLPVTKENALPLYVGISTDTGCFRYSNTTSNTHMVAAKLIETGIDVAAINEELFESRRLERTIIEAKVMENMRFFCNGAVAVSSLSMEEINAVGANEDDMDALSALPRRIYGVDIGILLREEENGVKVSVRTSSKYSASDLCQNFGGGGHARAAGAMLEKPLEKAFTLMADAAQSFL